jgi:hypothetical protein
MPTELLTIGPVHSLVQNVIYALPARRILLYADTGTITVSADGSNFTSVTLTNNQAELAAAFIKNTGTTADVKLAVA